MQVILKFFNSKIKLHQHSYPVTDTGATVALFEEAYLTSTHVNMKWETFLPIYVVHLVTSLH